VSGTPDLDETIALLNGMLGSAPTLKEKLQVTDRLARFMALKYKHGTEGKGSKFTSPDNKGTENGN
jgi:hypothetical protein